MNRLLESRYGCRKSCFGDFQFGLAECEVGQRRLLLQTSIVFDEFRHRFTFFDRLIFDDQQSLDNARCKCRDANRCWTRFDPTRSFEQLSAFVMSFGL